jgi:phosphoribosylanthranilate isomerase
LLEADPRCHEMIIAGGINPKNVKKASDLLPFALDIASGVEEDDPRKKSYEKIRELFFQLRP